MAPIIADFEQQVAQPFAKVDLETIMRRILSLSEARVIDGERIRFVPFDDFIEDYRCLYKRLVSKETRYNDGKLCLQMVLGLKYFYADP
jgi:hypothetical protein